MLKAFLSYHHAAGRTARHLKEGLHLFGIDVFLAHEDLQPSTEWQKEIFRHLRHCDIFIPLLTRRYHSSLWADQETGIAFALNKHILPLKFHTNPYGFIGKFQALRRHHDLDETCWRIVRHLASIHRFKRAAKDGVIEAFLSSGSFEESASRSSHLLELGEYSGIQLNRIIDGAAENRQIYGGWRATDAVRRVITGNEGHVSEALVRRFERRVRS